MILTGNMMTANEAESSGLVAKVVPNAEVSSNFYSGISVDHDKMSLQIPVIVFRFERDCSIVIV